MPPAPVVEPPLPPMLIPPRPVAIDAAQAQDIAAATAGAGQMRWLNTGGATDDAEGHQHRAERETFRRPKTEMQHKRSLPAKGVTNGGRKPTDAKPLPPAA